MSRGWSRLVVIIVVVILVTSEVGVLKPFVTAQHWTIAIFLVVAVLDLMGCHGVRSCVVPLLNDTTAIWCLVHVVMILHSTSCRNTHFVSTPCTGPGSRYSSSLSQPAHDTVVLVGGTSRADTREVFGGNLRMWNAIAASRKHSSVGLAAELRRLRGDLAFTGEQSCDAARVYLASTSM